MTDTNKDLSIKEQLAAKNNPDAGKATVDTADDSIPAKNNDAAADDAPQEVPVELLAWAETYDISLDEAKSIGAAGLSRMRDRVDSEIANAAGKSVTGTTDAAKTEKLSLKLDEVEWGPNGREAMNALVDKINFLEGKLADVQGGVETSIKIGREARINSLLDAAKDYETVIGTGHARGRARVVDQIAVMEAGYKATGKPIPPDSQLVKAALAAVYPDHQTKLTSAKAVAKARDTQGQFISRPSQRNGQPKEGREKVLEEIAQIRERALARG